MITTLTIASRESPLAMWQAEYIKKGIQGLYPSININIEGFKTQGDILLDQSLATIGGKGLFIKELDINNLILRFIILIWVLHVKFN